MGSDRHLFQKFRDVKNLLRDTPQESRRRTVADLQDVSGDPLLRGKWLAVPKFPISDFPGLCRNYFVPPTSASIECTHTTDNAHVPLVRTNLSKHKGVILCLNCYRRSSLYL